jgi:hypothetical protein
MNYSGKEMLTKTENNCPFIGLEMHEKSSGVL